MYLNQTKVILLNTPKLVIMIHKKTGRENFTDDVTSCRSIGLTLILSKQVKKILLSRVALTMVESGIIPNYQFDFRQNHSTMEQVHRVDKSMI